MSNPVMDLCMRCNIREAQVWRWSDQNNRHAKFCHKCWDYIYRQADRGARRTVREEKDGPCANLTEGDWRNSEIDAEIHTAAYADRTRETVRWTHELERIMLEKISREHKAKMMHSLRK